MKNEQCARLAAKPGRDAGARNAGRQKERRSWQAVPAPSPHATAIGGRQSKIIKNEIAIPFLNDC